MNMIDTNDQDVFSYSTIEELRESPTYLKYKAKIEQEDFYLTSKRYYASVPKGTNTLNLFHKEQFSQNYLHYPKFTIEGDMIDGKRKACHTYKFIDLWLTDPTKRTHTRVVFEPNNENVKEGEYNLFHGFKNDDSNVEPIDPNQSYFFKLLKHICVLDERMYDYIVTLLAHIVQKPWIRSKVFVLFYADNYEIGTFRFIDGLEQIIGEEYYGHMCSHKDFSVKCKYRSYLCNKLIISVPENDYDSSSKLKIIKHAITCDTNIMKKKRKEPICFNEYSTYFGNITRSCIFGLKHPGKLKITNDDKNFMIIRCPDRIVNTDFIHQYDEEIENPIKLKQIFRYLKLYQSTIHWEVGVTPYP